MDSKETRVLVAPLEVRRLSDKKKTKIAGYAARFNSRSEDLGGFYEVIEPGAFTEVLGDDVRALINHNPDLILGRTPNTLTLTQDDSGLRYEVELPDTSYARDLLQNIEAGNIDQSSFAFIVAEDSWVEPETPNALPTRRIIRIGRLHDVSAVTYPAYPAATVEALRSMAHKLSTTGAGASVQSEAWRLPLYKRQLNLLERF